MKKNKPISKYLHPHLTSSMLTRYLEQIKRFVLIICCNFFFIKEPVYAKPAIRYEKDKTTKGNINICVLKITLFKQIR